MVMQGRLGLDITNALTFQRTAISLKFCAIYVHRVLIDDILHRVQQGVSTM